MRSSKKITKSKKIVFDSDKAEAELKDGTLFRNQKTPIFEDVHLSVPPLKQHLQDAINFAATHPFVNLTDALKYMREEVEVKEIVLPFTNMSEEQLKQILPFLNKYCFKDNLTLEQLKEIFNYKLNHVPVDNVSILTFFFNKLRRKKLIIDCWQTIIEEKEMFASTRSGKLLKKKNISHVFKAMEQSNKNNALSKRYHKNILIVGIIDNLIENL